MKRKNIFLISISIILMISGFIAAKGKEVSGSDDKAIEVIGQVNKEYKPWVNSIWEPSGEMENLLFGVQAIAGISIIGFYVRYKLRCSRQSHPTQK